MWIHVRNLSGMLLLCLLILVGPADAQQAQEAEPHPLLTMLAHIPNREETRNSLITYHDDSAIALAYPGAQTPTDWAQFEAAEDNPAMNAWWGIKRNSISNLAQNFILGADWPRLFGIEIFQIERDLSAGSPPGNILLLEGDFAAADVAVALAARDFAQESADTDGLELWCGPGGCDDGLRQDLTGRDPADPFGGQLGRKQPLVIGDGYMFGSAALEMVEAHLAVARGESQSLGDLPAYQAMVAAITQDRTLIQAVFLDSTPMLETFMSSPVQNLLMARQGQQQEVIDGLEAYLESYEDMPTPILLGFADATTETEQLGIVALVYVNVEDAQAAAEVLPARLQNYTSLRTRRPMTDMFEDMRLTQYRAEVFETESNAVTLLLLGTPKADYALIPQIVDISLSDEERPDFTAPGLIYRQLYNMLIARDTGWLSTVSRASLEADLEAIKGG